MLDWNDKNFDKSKAEPSHWLDLQDSDKVTEQNIKNLTENINDKSSLRQWAKSFDFTDQSFNPLFIHSFLKTYSTPGQIWGVFNAIQNEPKIDWDLFQNYGIKFALPKVTSDGLKFYKSVDSASSQGVSADSKLNPKLNLELKSTVSRLGILEPQGGQELSDLQIQGLIIPGLVFDHRGQRLGRGQAHYDQFLKTYSGLKVGLTWSTFFVPASLPKEVWDVDMDFIITEKFLYQPMFLKKSPTESSSKMISEITSEIKNENINKIAKEIANKNTKEDING